MIDRLGEFAVLATILSSGWILLVLVIRPFAIRQLGARWAYALWAVPLIGLLAMMLPDDALKAAFNWPTLTFPFLPGLLSRTAATMDGAVQRLGGNGGSPATLLNWAVMATWCWLVIALGFVARLMTQCVQAHLRATRSSRELSSPERDLLKLRLETLARRYDVDIRMLTTSEGPAVTGIVSPRLYLPSDFFDRFDAQQQSLILAHELHHICRRDVIVQMLARLHRCLFWFNPLAWVAERGVLLDQELSCDEHVLRSTDLATRRQYGQAMLMAAQGARPVAHAGYSSFSHMRQRAALLRAHKPAPLRNALGAGLLALVMIPSLVFGLLGSFEPQRQVRPQMNTAMVEIMSQLQCAKPDQATLQVLLSRIDELRSISPPLSGDELAGLHGLSALTHHRLGNTRDSLAEFQLVTELSRGTLNIPPTSLCELNYVYLADQGKALEVETR